MWLDFRRGDDSTSAYLAAIGRALSLAQNLEHNAKFVLAIGSIAKGVTEGTFRDVPDDSMVLVEAIEKKMLGALERGFHDLGGIEECHLEALRRARIARNFLAHEATVLLFQEPPEQWEARIEKFRSVVLDLIAADDLLSAWSYSIQEKTSATAIYRENYRREAYSWVVDDLNLADPPAPQKPSLAHEYWKTILKT